MLGLLEQKNFECFYTGNKNQKVKIITFQKWDSQFYESCYYHRLQSLNESVQLNTADLVSTIQQVNSRAEIYYENAPWRFLTCLGILAREGLMDLSLRLDFHKEDVSPPSIIYNLTPVVDPYWAVEAFVGDKKNISDVYQPVWRLSIQKQPTKSLYAKANANAVNKILTKSNNNWFKVWHEEKCLPIEEYTELDHSSGATLRPIPNNVVVINDGTKPLEF